MSPATAAVLGTLIWVLSGAAADAQQYPARPIRLVVGFTPGTATDIAARTFANGAEGLLDQKIIVENKPGAGSNVAAEYVARAPNDGYTLFVPALSTLTNEIVNPAPSFDMTKDFAPMALIHRLLSVIGETIDSALNPFARHGTSRSPRKVALIMSPGSCPVNER